MPKINAGAVTSGLALEYAEFDRGIDAAIASLKGMKKEAGAAGKAVDGLDSSLDDTGAAAGSASKKIDSAGKSSSNAAKNFKTADTNSQALSSSMGSMAIAAGVAIAGFQMLANETEVYKGQLADIGVVTGQSKSELEALGVTLGTLGVQTGQFTDATNQAQWELASALGATNVSMEKQTFALMAMTAGHADAKTTMGLAGAQMKAFGDTSDAAMKKSLGLAFMVSELGVVTFPEYASAVQKVVTTQNALGGSQEEMAAVFATLTGVTGDAARVSTQLLGAHRALIKPSKDMSAAIAEVGRQHLNNANATSQDLVKALGLVGAFEALIATTDGTSESIGKLFPDTEGLTAVMELAGNQADTYAEKLGKMTNAGDALEKKYKIVTEGVNAQGFAMQQSRVKMEQARIAIGDALMPAMTALNETAADTLGWIAGFIKEWPNVSKLIGGSTAILVATGGAIAAIAIAAPKAIAGFTALKAAVIAMNVPLGTSIAGMGALATGLSTVAAVGAAAFVGWQIGSLINELDFVADGVTNLFETIFTMSTEAHEQLQMMKMGWTDQGKAALSARDQIIELAQGIDSSVTGLRDAATELANNKEEYEKLSPKLKEVVDGMTAYRGEQQFVALTSQAARTEIVKIGQSLNENVKGLRDSALEIRNNATAYQALTPQLKTIVDGMTAAKDAAEKTKGSIKDIPNAIEETRVPTEEELKKIAALHEANELAIQEASMSSTEFKIFQLQREYQENLTFLHNVGAAKSEFEVLEQAHQVRMQAIKNDAAATAAKELEKLKKDEEKKRKDEEKKLAAHADFINGLEKERRDLIVQNTDDLAIIRANEVANILAWEQEKLMAVAARLADEQISIQQADEQKSAILETGIAKREQAEADYLERSEAAEKAKNQRVADDFKKTVDNIAGWANQTLGFLSDLSDLERDKKIANIEDWYEAERQRIEDSEMTNEARTDAIEALDLAMHEKKAAIENESARRERALQMASAIANTAVGITTAIKSAPWPLNIPAIAFAIAQGAIAIAKIKSVGGSGGANFSIGDGGGSGAGTGGGGGAGTGGGVGGGGSGAGGIGSSPGTGGGGSRPAFQEGTGGFITPPPIFTVGEGAPEAIETVEMTGDTSRVRMRITPTPGGPSDGPAPIIINFNVQSMDAASFDQSFQEQIAPRITDAIETGLIRVNAA